MAGGLATMCVTLVSLTTLQVDTSLWFIRGIMLAMGFGMSFIFIPMQAAAMARISAADTGHASAIFNTQRQVASAFGVAILATVLSVRLPDVVAGVPPSTGAQVGAYHDVFLVGALMAAIGIVAALMIKDRDAASTMRVVRAPEESQAGSQAAGGR
jgi:hypothetical protein